MKNDKGIHSDSERPQDRIDATYNKENHPIIEKTQNAYVMPLDMQRDVDIIDTFRFYEDTTKVTKKRDV
ncbi:hypothetical protein [Crassaminicella indica]|uniref:Uncharacterized protein n=1 Tax=Crassaminicella indica TaxID=2855394 RepID=A0ABX8RAK9_9CLOT|nr:hypothetical protein [Crassaminicella indica]QXM05302.1 hypothetical protein KVH43_07815 [Crassaminicella indica]